MKYSKLRYIQCIFLTIFVVHLFLCHSLAETEIQNRIIAEDRSENKEMVTVNVQNIDINAFFRGLAKKRKINIITSEDVSGTISVNLHNIPLEEVMEAVSIANGYQCRKKNNIYFIVKEKQKAKEVAAIGAIVKSFRINYADIAAVRKVVEDFVGKDRVTMHKDAKVLIVEESLENINKVARIIKELDFPPKQVLIEAKILEVTLGDRFSLGVDWEKTFDVGNASGTVATKDFSLPKDAEGAKGFFFDVIRKSDRLKVFLDALESRSDINVLATPKLLALDSKPAEIIIGGRLGYYVTQTTETSTLQSVEFLDIGTQLKLTPHISDDGKILMQIHPEVSDGSIDAIGLPSTRTTEVTTSLLTDDGDTIFLGGLIRETTERTSSKIPVLGNIPLIGAFFGQTEDRNTKTEIVILITPQIVSSENQAIYAEKIDVVERAEAAQHEERSTAQKIFIPDRMFEDIQNPLNKMKIRAKTDRESSHDEEHE